MSRPRRRGDARPPARERREQGRIERPRGHVVAGARAIGELLDVAPARVTKILAATGRDDDVLARAESLGIAVQRVSPAELARLAPDGPTKGIVALADPPTAVELDDLVAAAIARPTSRLVALDGVLDPHNLGAILRSAEFFGAAGAFWARDHSAPLSPAAVRASAGASERLPHAIVTNLARALQSCRDAGMWVLGTVPEGGRDLRELVGELPDRLVIVLGGEQSGLRRLTREHCDFLATIAGAGAIASLNVSAAAAVVLAALA